MPTNVRLADYLQPAYVAVPLRATTVQDALQEMVQRLRQLGAVTPDAEFEQQLARSRPRDVVALEQPYRPGREGFDHGFARLHH